MLLQQRLIALVCACFFAFFSTTSYSDEYWTVDNGAGVFENPDGTSIRYPTQGAACAAYFDFACSGTRVCTNTYITPRANSEKDFLCVYEFDSLGETEVRTEQVLGRGLICEFGSIDPGLTGACYSCEAPAELDFSGDTPTCSLTCPKGKFFALNSKGKASCVDEDQPSSCSRTGSTDASRQGNPIDFITGDKFHKVSLYSASGAFPLNFTYHYNNNSGNEVSGCSELASESQKNLDSYTPGETYTTTAFRYTSQDMFYAFYPDIRSYYAKWNTCANLADLKWKHNYQYFLNIGTGGLTHNKPDGVREEYTLSSGKYISENSRYGTFEVIDGQYVLVMDDNTTHYYDANGRLTKITNTNGLSHTLAYDTGHENEEDNNADRLISITDDFGRTLTLVYDTDPLKVQPTKLIDPENNEYILAFSGSNLSSIEYPDSQKVSYLYGSNGIEIVKDSYDRTKRTYTYYDDGRAESTSVDGTINKFTMEYVSDLQTTVTNPLGKQTIYKFNTQNGQKRIEEVDGIATEKCVASNSTTTHDNFGYKDIVIEKNGTTTDYDFNSRGLEEKVTYAVGTSEEREETTEWHATLPLPLKETAPGRETTYTYDEQGRKLSETITDLNTDESRTLSYEFNTEGLLTKIDGPRDDVEDITTFTYDAKGNVITETNAAGHVKTYSDYNEHGQAQTITDANGVVTEFRYDSRQRPVSITKAAGTEDASTLEMLYDFEGNLVRHSLADGSVLDYEYDVANRLIAIEDSLGNRIEYTLDSAGNRTLIQVKDNQGNISKKQSTIYDELNRVYTALGADNQSTDSRYDAAGNNISITDPLSRTTTNEYDNLNRVIKTLDPIDGSIEITYNDRDEVTSITDQRGLTTTYTLNAFGEIVSQTSPDTGVTTYEYDKSGNQTKTTDSRGVETNYSYDELDRVISINYSTDDRYNVIYQWDEGAYGIGFISKVYDSFSEKTYTYDIRGNVLTESLIINGNTFTTSFEYDISNKTTQVQHHNGYTIDMIYNTNRQVTSLVQQFNSTATNLIDTITWQPFGGVNAFNFSNGIAYSHSYDLDGRSDTISTPTSDKRYSYDLASNITQIDRDDTLAQRITDQIFGYDELDRLISESGQYGTRDYQYDSVGNRTQRNRVHKKDEDDGTTTVKSGTQIYTYSATANQLIDKNGKTYEFDAAGNLIRDRVVDTTGDAKRELSYDPQGRLFELTRNNTVKTQYQYNAFNQRVQKTKYKILTCPVDELTGEVTDCELTEDSELKNTWYYLYDLNGQHLTDIRFNSNGVMKEVINYVWLGTMPVSQTTTVYKNDGSVKSSNTIYIHTDHLNTPRQATDSTQTVVWNWEADAFGQGKQDKDPDGDGVKHQVRLRFPGQYFDSESGLFYNWNRYYDKALGRYITSDPIGIDGGINTYGYALQNPVTFIDILGLSACRKAGNKACKLKKRQCNSKMCGFLQPTTCAIPCQKLEEECKNEVAKQCAAEDDSEDEKTPEEKARDRMRESLDRARKHRQQSSLPSGTRSCSI